MPYKSVATETQERLAFVDLHTDELGSDFLADVIEGFSQAPKTLSPKYFYDHRGSELFEKITEQPEYYLTRTELSIMERSVGEMCTRLHEKVVLVELGSGSSMKTRTLLREMLDRNIDVLYVPVDISRDFLHHSAREISELFPALRVEAVCADFSQGVKFIGQSMRASTDQKVVYFPGSTIGNFQREEARALLADIAGELTGDDGLLLGTDLRKDVAILEAAYNDKNGVTAAFNLNMLYRMRNELGARIDPERFRHVALFNESESRIEMHLESLVDQEVHLNRHSFRLARGERIHTECSHKYSLEQLHALARETGFELLQSWSDPRNFFGVHWFGVQS